MENFKPEKTPSAQIVFLQPSTFVVAGTTIKDPDEVLLHMVDGGVVDSDRVFEHPALGDHGVDLPPDRAVVQLRLLRARARADSTNSVSVIFNILLHETWENSN